MLHLFFYGLPLMGAFVYGLLKPGCTWMSDWTMFLAGAMIQVTPWTQTLNKWRCFWIHSLGRRCCILKWVPLTVCCITWSNCDNYWLLIDSAQRSLTHITAIKLYILSSPVSNVLQKHFLFFCFFLVRQKDWNHEENISLLKACF